MSFKSLHILCFIVKTVSVVTLSSLQQGINMVHTDVKKKKNLTFEAGQMPKFTAGHIFECWALIG